MVRERCQHSGQLDQWEQSARPLHQSRPADAAQCYFTRGHFFLLIFTSSSMQCRPTLSVSADSEVKLADKPNNVVKRHYKLLLLTKQVWYFKSENWDDRLYYCVYSKMYLLKSVCEQIYYQRLTSNCKNYVFVGCVNIRIRVVKKLINIKSRRTGHIIWWIQINRVSLKYCEHVS